MKLRLILLILELFAVIAIGKAKVERACQNRHMTMRCFGNDIIHVKAANYGRTSSVFCPGEAPNRTNCRAKMSYQKVTEHCSRKKECTLKASNSLFGNPCADVTKYLEVDFECVQPGYKSVGCFKDSFFGRAIGGRIQDFLTNPIRSCYLKAKRLGYEYFAVQNNKQCFTSAKAGKTYKKYGAGSGCKNGRGGSWRNDVYKVTAIPTPRVSVDATGTRIRFKCDITAGFETGRIYEVEWFHTVNGKDVKISEEILTKNVAYLENAQSTRMFRVGYTVFAKLITWVRGHDKASGAVQESNKYYLGIKLAPATLRVSESGNPVNLQVISTSPILCEDGSTNCSVMVRLVQSRADVLLSACTLVFQATTKFPVSHTVTVAAKRDFIDNGDVRLKISSVAEYLPGPSGSGDWYKPTSPSTVEVTTASVSGGRCTSTGDPHIRTFDNVFFNHYYIGDYTLVKSTSRRFEVQVRTRRCARVACNCGVAVREGDDVLVVDMCRNNFSPDPRYASNKEPARGTYIERSANGKTFILRFASGAVVKYVAKHWFGSTYYADVTVQSPPDDYRNTKGLCGVFDKSKTNDMSSKNGKVWKNCGRQACTGFTESWKLSRKESLFYYKPAHKSLQCRPAVTRSHCLCGRKTGICNIPIAPPLLKRATRGYTRLAFAGQAECERNRKPIIGKPVKPIEPSQPVITLPSPGNNSVYPYVPTETQPTLPSWPTESGVIEEVARSICVKGIEESALYRVCKKYVDASMIQGFLGQCVTDIQILDRKGVHIAIRAATEALLETCKDNIIRNPASWKTDENGQTVPPVELINITCPNLCSGNGVCIEGLCTCNKGFQSEDCSLLKGQKPELKMITNGGVCRLGGETDCRTVRIISGKLIPGNVTCSFKVRGKPEISIPGKLLSFSEVVCTLPHLSCGKTDFADMLYTVRLANHKDWSENLLFYRVVNPLCIKCKGNTCIRKASVCIVNGCCYSAEDSNPNDLKCSYCNPSVNSTEFTTRDTAGCRVHPCDIKNGGCDDMCMRNGEKAMCMCTLPRTKLGKDGRTCVPVHPCDIKNGGCGDMCMRKGEKAMCMCTLPRTKLGKDGRTCVPVHLCDIKNGGCDDMCMRKGGKAMCMCTLPRTKLGKHGKTCVPVHPCDIKNGGCDDMCMRKGEKAMCMCTLPRTKLGKDNRTCVPVHPCDIKNGGCGDMCMRKGEKAMCMCTLPRTELGKDGKTCVPASTYVIHINVSTHISYSGMQGTAIPRLVVQLSMNPFRPGRFVPERCYVTPTVNRLDPYRIYFIRDRYPVIPSYYQHVLYPRMFSFGVPARGIFRRHVGPTYLHCRCRVCPPNSSKCSFAQPARREDEEKFDDEVEKFVHTTALILNN